MVATSTPSGPSTKQVCEIAAEEKPNEETNEEGKCSEDLYLELSRGKGVVG
jgi:hypothetical protein